jgi:putative membrane protein
VKRRDPRRPQEGDVFMYAKFGIAIAALAFAFATAPAQSADAPTDPQIAHIAYTADNIDIDAAQLALKTSKNPDHRLCQQHGR